MATLTVKVNRVAQESLDIKSFELISATGDPLPPFAAGSHVDVHIDSGLIRQYSLCNGPHETDRYLIAVKKEPESRGGSRAMHERIREGDVIAVSAPRNNFPIEQQAKHHLLLAGGIGITPVFSMARHLLAAGESFELQYFTRSIQHTAFHALLSGLDFKRRVTFHYAIEPDALRAYLRKLLWHRPEGAHLYLCGPRQFMDLVETTAAPTWPPEAVHLEYFAADPMSLTGSQETFQVRLARSDTTFAVPAGRSIVEVLAEHGVHIETSCEQGVCGTCLTGVLDGVPDHRDVFLTDAEKQACDKIMPCVSRAKSLLLVLDL
ncbi:PDR/VanB family oxidoreductase [Caballeronia sp. LZ029]|uniref:PDR/VanB family oxidoreductase n=1 Tax=Caballeronia sp. LZ029 TaxID=3038564 RepID=UPI0028648DFA|nr:PDR/VanB family oxidoreductase [Caballeronia sp. LZ029]MDR5748897.1 PDR/VanB family oxidoreductase [Caballeronia sp. LZ029]